MATPKVSLLMPVYNSFSYERSDGKRLLPIAITSLLNQSYQDFELIILDNQSSDDTPNLCKSFAKKDSRIRYVLDERKRFAEEAITHLGSLAKAPYCMIVNDDDIWDRNYISNAVDYLESNPQIDLVYGKVLFVNTRNIIVGGYFSPKSEQYDMDITAENRFLRYMQLRNVLPINFGLFRTEAFKKVLPYEDFDTLKANVDNVFMSKFFLLGYKAHYKKNMLFFYRRKRRMLNPKLFAHNMPYLNDPVGIWLFYMNHQILFFKKILSLVEKSDLKLQILKYKELIISTFIDRFFEDLIALKTELVAQNYILEKNTLDKIVNYYRTLVNKKENLIMFIEWSYNLGGKNESFVFKNNVISFLNLYLKENTGTEKFTPNKLLSLYGLKIKIREYPVLKKIINFIYAIFLNTLYLNKLLYIRNIK